MEGKLSHDQAADLLEETLPEEEAFDELSEAGEKLDRQQVAGGSRRGLREVACFVREKLGVHVLAITIGLAGAALGWLVTEPFVGALDMPIVARLEAHVPPAAALNFFSNKLMVALATTYSGMALGIPAVF